MTSNQILSYSKIYPESQFLPISATASSLWLELPSPLLDLMRYYVTTLGTLTGRQRATYHVFGISSAEAETSLHSLLYPRAQPGAWYTELSVC